MGLKVYLAEKFGTEADAQFVEAVLDPGKRQALMAKLEERRRLLRGIAWWSRMMIVGFMLFHLAFTWNSPEPAHRILTVILILLSSYEDPELYAINLELRIAALLAATEQQASAKQPG